MGRRPIRPNVAAWNFGLVSASFAASFRPCARGPCGPPRQSSLARRVRLRLRRARASRFARASPPNWPGERPPQDFLRWPPTSTPRSRFCRTRSGNRRSSCRGRRRRPLLSHSLRPHVRNEPRPRRRQTDRRTRPVDRSASAYAPRLGRRRRLRRNRRVRAARRRENRPPNYYGLGAVACGGSLGRVGGDRLKENQMRSLIAIRTVGQ